jgi:hypothetical protein
MKLLQNSARRPLMALALAWSLAIPAARSQDISWGAATGITGDANLSTAGVYYDAFLPNTASASPLSADGVTFNVDTIVDPSSTSDGTITCTVTSGTLNNYSGGSFPSSSPSSPAFAAIMNAGGIYQVGGAGAGTVTVSGLTPGQNYIVQVFNYVSDGDAGLTTLSGVTPVTLGNLPGAGGANTYGEFATGTFTATSTTETFNWNGAGSGYTVLGAISVRSVPANLPPTISVDTTPNSVTAYQYSTTTFSAAFGGTPPMTLQWESSVDAGITFTNIAGATNSTLTVTNSLAVTNVEYYLLASNAYGTNNSSPASLTVIPVPPQTITWGPTTGITGDNNLLTNGIYVDAFIPNTSSSVVSAGALAADGITFNVATSSSASGGSDGIISFNVLSGNNNSYNFTTFPTTAPSSPAFAAIMNAGGTYQNGGAGQGIVIISSLTTGHAYSIEVFNYANDGDPGLTTLSGSNSVALSNLPGAGGAGTYGEFATGTFTATSTNESFYWQGAGSSYTVLGAISVLDITSASAPIVSADTTPSSVTAYLNSTTAFTAAFIGVQPITNRWQVSVNGGTNFTDIAGAAGNTLTVTNSALVTNVLYRLAGANAYGTTYTTPASLTVIPAPGNTINWGPPVGIVGDTNLSTNGVYFDGLMLNTAIGSGLAVDGYNFNNATNLPNGSYGDGTISYGGNGLNTFSWPNTFPVGGTASSDFATLMDDGGIFQNGGNGSGAVVLSGLTVGHVYTVQVFNYAPDGDAGLTTFSGSTPVTLSNLPGAGGAGTYGEVATGTFTANSTAEQFTWQGAGSSYTVVGSVLVLDSTGYIASSPPTLTSSFSGSQLHLSWPSGYTGWKLQMQFNQVNGTNWVNVAGSTAINATNFPVSTTNQSVFFRLVSP